MTARHAGLASRQGPGCRRSSRDGGATGSGPAGELVHLTWLRECGLVTATVEGRRVCYELADQCVAEGLRILAALDLPSTCW